MPRSVPEWVGATDDAKVPPRVRLRIWEREEGRCWISGRKIMPGEPWELDHKVALINGGQHRESNLFPALKDKHREKTKEDVAIKKETVRVRSKFLSIRKPKGRPMPGTRASGLRKRFDGTVERR